MVTTTYTEPQGAVGHGQGVRVGEKQKKKQQVLILESSMVEPRREDPELAGRRGSRSKYKSCDCLEWVTGGHEGPLDSLVSVFWLRSVCGLWGQAVEFASG